MANLMYPAKPVHLADSVTIPGHLWNQMVADLERLEKATIVLRDWVKDGYDGGASVPVYTDYKDVLYATDCLAADLAAAMRRTRSAY